MKDEVDTLKLVVACGAGCESAHILHYLARNQRWVLFPSFVTAKKKVAVIAFQVTTFTDLKNDIQVVYLHGLAAENAYLAFKG